jgi:hypothetical protein
MRFEKCRLVTICSRVQAPPGGSGCGREVVHVVRTGEARLGKAIAGAAAATDVAAMALIARMFE